MGIYLNSGNDGYREILQSEYVDKTGLIALINNTLGTTEKLTCISRPRRFGKSYAAKMLCAYYDCSCDSRNLFDDKEIARSQDYLTHLNQYQVISLDITGFISDATIRDIPLSNMPNMIADAVCRDLTKSYPEMEGKSLADAMIGCAEKSGKRFVLVIDEWDAVIREAKGDTMVQKKYLNFLQGWFKNSNFMSKAVATVYMTGILPIKKNGSQSAISDFKEVTILNPGRFVEYTGFTESDVRSLCGKYGMDFEEVRQWYDGYDFPGYGAIYNPYSVMCAMQEQKCRSYWRRTSAAESLMTYINMDFEGLQETIARLISDEEIAVRTDRFENDFETFKSRDDVLTLLIHLGYLTWNEEEGTAHVPNEEVREEFEQILEGTGASHPKEPSGR